MLVLSAMWGGPNMVQQPNEETQGSKTRLGITIAYLVVGLVFMFVFLAV